MTAKRHLKIKIDEEKCKVLKDLENGRSKKDVSEKYGVPRNTICKWLKNKEKISSDLISQVHILNERKCVLLDCEDIEACKKESKCTGVLWEKEPLIL